MSRTIRITPAGRLLVEPAADEQPALDPSAARDIEQAFEHSTPHGLIFLAAHYPDNPLPLPLVFWRHFAQRYFHDVSHGGDEDQRTWKHPWPPAKAELDALIAEAPPMPGLEYLSADLLEQFWEALGTVSSQQAEQHPEGIKGYLRDVNPLWHLLGRVTFHLAENKRDAQRPFAFMATYTHRISQRAKLQHLPLGQALKEYAGEKNQARLTSLLEPVRRAAEQSDVVRELLESRMLFQPHGWSISQAYRFLRQVPDMEAAGIVVRVPDWWHAHRPPRPQVAVRIGNKAPQALGLDSLLDFEIHLVLDGEPLSEDERQQLLSGTDGLLLLRGKWVEVDADRLRQALDHWQHLEAQSPDGVSFIEGMRMLAGAPLADKSGEELIHAEWAHVTAGDWLRTTLATLRDPSRAADLQPGIDLEATLRPYQVDGVRWLWFMTRLGLGACLADDMGLGKTIQVIDLILQLKRAAASAAGDGASPSADALRARAPCLLVVPASLIGNWKRELQRFAPSVNVQIVHRSECDADQFDRIADDPQRALANTDIVVTTYGLVRRSPWFARMSWRLVILDEAQAIKNAAAAQTRAVKKLSSTARIALTGTPVENHLGDLWSIFDFTCPGLLGSASQFKQYIKRLSKRQDAAAYGGLRRLVQPYILRRMKTDPEVAADLPDKTEMRTDCGLSKKQAVLYARTIEELERKLEDADGMARRGLVLSVLMQLKQICNHPAQLLNIDHYAPEDSDKFLRLAEICGPIIERQEKVLVFSQFQSICQPLADYLSTVFKQSGLVLTGQTPVRRRSELVECFQQDTGPPFLVISVKAGGSGLNLTAASHVVHFDRWWNPAVENQATDRAFRIGQRRNVLVHKFVCRGTVEERIDQMIRDKQALSDQLLDQASETLITEMPDDELLRFVALDLNRAMADD